MILMPILLILTMSSASLDEDSPDSVILPEHLAWWPGLYVRIGDEIVDAPEADQLVARGYPFFENRGEVRDGRRMTIMAAPGPYCTGDEVRIIHVVEAPEPGWQVFAMGPKVVYGEFVDGVLVTEAPPGWEDPFVPEMYDGGVLDSPAVDYNYDITSHVFLEPGIHEVQWIMDGWESNVLVIEVLPAADAQP